MYLVDDVHTVFTGSGSEVDFFTDVTDIIYAVVTCGVDFCDI